ncbi:endolytic transglycosylase MltG [Halioxenophilus sp. WMMB6]|uniref:endolytic transglycosylase MltG n=1 Tax=Halioxenophilus sp. WMMB6 TaxID=3073815 RepID=UPI00295F43A8|nr:endolytic transglycosylase MltG [Halioxenophilus sp. WMMB6]
MKRLLKLLLIVAVLVIASGAYSVWQFNLWLHKPLALESEVILQVERGSTITKTLINLANQGVVSYPKALLVYSKITKQTAIKQGEYRITPGMSWVDVNQMLISGNAIDHQLTLIEGWRAADALQALHDNPRVVRTLDSLLDPSLVNQLPAEHANPEGWFFADTYHFRSGDTDLAILLRAYNKMQTTLQQLWQQRSAGLPYDSPYQALIMASIVEKETGLASERAQIAGVFVRRLQKNMRLQTDPTVIYGLGDSYQGNLTRAHLSQPTDYNTYMIRGLPPTPIALVGYESLAAAMQPAEGDALYFVAKGDGSHQFSATLAEHNRAVRQYQILNRRDDYQSAPKQ